MFVMGGALLVALPTFQWALRRSKPLCNVCFELPSKTGVDANLILGALLFGAGWGEVQGCSGVLGGRTVDVYCGGLWHDLSADSAVPRAGLGGICPGPGLVALASLQTKAVVFVAAMLAGMRADHTAEQFMCAVKGA